VYISDTFWINKLIFWLIFEYSLQDDQLKATIQDLLKDADLKNHTMKILSQKVYALYPNSNLEATKKDFIRATAKSLLVDVELT